MTQQLKAIKEIFSNLFGALMAFALEQEFLQDLGESLEVFYNLKEGEEYEFRPTEEFLFLTWFLVDDTTPDGFCLMDEFLKRHSDNLSLTETQVCKALKETHLSLFQVKKVVNNVSMSLRDVFTGESFDVAETTGAEDVAEDTLLFSRILRLGEERFLVGAGIFMDPSVTEPITAFITEQYRECCEEGYTKSFKDFLKENGELINWWIRSFDKGELTEDENEDEDEDKPDNKS